MMRLVKFAGASGLGLTLDVALYTVLCAAGVEPGIANLLSATLGVTTVFLLSAHSIFDSADHFLLRLFAAYAVYQVLAIAAASWAVDAMTEVFDGRYLLGKAVVLPATFAANYLFMHWLFSERSREEAVTT